MFANNEVVFGNDGGADVICKYKQQKAGFADINYVAKALV